MITLTPLSVVTTLFVFYILRFVYKKYKSNQISIIDLVFWYSFWLLLLVVVFNPPKTDLLANIFGVGRGVDLFVFLSIVLLFYLIFRIYIKLEQLEKTITELVRKIALDRHEKKK